MSIFNLHGGVLDDYRDFVRSFITIADLRAKEFLDEQLDQESRLWPDYLLQVSPSYSRTATVDELATRGVLHEETARIFRGADRPHDPGQPVALIVACRAGTCSCTFCG